MDELISRQMAINGKISVQRTNGLEIYYDEAVPVEFLKSLPSVQPKITCDGCRFVGTYDTDLPCRNCVRREKDYYDPER